MIKKVFSATLLLFFSLTSLFSQTELLKKQWVDSVFNTMTEDEKIGQLFMVSAYSGGNEQHYQVIENLINKHHIGGLIFMQGHPASQVALTNRYQEAANVPLLIGMDMEWGAAMRLDSVLSFPRQMNLGAIQNDSLIYNMGAEIAQQMKILGVHVNFAPVADINNNPKNPIIGMRSFGENRELVTRKAMAYMKGMQDNGVLACAKHFPGHGDTDKDSHETLPEIKHNLTRLTNVELYPFKQLIDKKIEGIMTGHMQVNAIDGHLPASLSPSAGKKLLRSELGFEGLMFTDALNMKAVTDQYKENVEVLAMAAGNDVLLFSQDVPGAVGQIKKALKQRKLSKSELDRSVKRILSAKYEAGLATFTPLNTNNVTLRLNNERAESLREQLFEKSATTVANTDNLIPIKIIDNKFFASLTFNDSSNLNSYLDTYAYFSHYNYAENPFTIKTLKSYDVVIVELNEKPTSEQLEVFNELRETTDVVIAYFGSPYHLTLLQDFDHVVCFYENNETTQMLAASAIFGGIGTTGKLPISASGIFAFGSGVDTPPLHRLSYSEPYTVGMSSKSLSRIDMVVDKAIKDMATPGCQILVAKDGRVVFEKSYGYYTYDSLKKVTSSTMYDLASITKVMASMQAFMFLEEHDLVDLDKKISLYLPDLEGTDKEYMTFRDILTHQAGLWPYVPFWKETIDDPLYVPYFYNEMPDQHHTVPIAQGLYGSSTLQDSVWQWVKHSKLREKEYRSTFDYKYSDLGYYFIQKLVEQVTNQPLEEFVQQNFFDPMGLASMGYLPLCRFPLSRIAPTENDNYFRHTLVYGMVHDQGAALFGGAAGHAGLFSNAHDLAKMMQMHLQKGTYGGTTYFKSETLHKFTARQYASNRRGIGWDKPLQGEWFGPTSEYASQKTFGHTGFTGTAVWADPEFDLIYVFLSNRIHPDASNAKLIKNNIRTRIQDIIYESIWDYRQHAENIN